MRLDTLDAKILASLQEDGRLSYRELAQRLDSTTPTIAARVKALEEIGVIRGYQAVVEAGPAGARTYLLTLQVEPQAVAQASEAVAKLPGVERLDLLSGGRLAVRIRLQPPATLHDLHDEVAGVPGLRDYEASEVLKTAAVAMAPQGLLDIDVPCHQCKGPIHDPVRAKLGGRSHVFCCRGCAATFRARFEAMAG